MAPSGFSCTVPKRDTAEPKPRLIDRQNRVALPTEVMKALEVKAGDYVAFHVEDAIVRLHKVRWSIERK